MSHGKQAGEWKCSEAEYLKQADCCDRCEVPRRLAALFYEQDLVVHHLSEASAGAPPWERYEALCRRCLEFETNGRSDLREIPPYAHCGHCKAPVWDYACHHGIEGLCADCTFMLWGLSPKAITSEHLVYGAFGELKQDVEFWKYAIRQIAGMIQADDVRRALAVSIECVESKDPGAWQLAMREIPSRVRASEQSQVSSDSAGVEGTEAKQTIH